MANITATAEPPQDPRDHPVQSRPPVIEYQATDASKAYSKYMAAKERADVEVAMRQEQLRTLAGVEGVRQLVAEWGMDRVILWARFAQREPGE